MAIFVFWEPQVHELLLYELLTFIYKTITERKRNI